MIQLRTIRTAVKDMPIKQVTVYPDQAEIQREWSSRRIRSLGCYEIVIHSFPGQFDESSVRISAKGANLSNVRIVPGSPENPELLGFDELQKKRVELEKRETILMSKIKRSMQQLEVWDSLMGKDLSKISSSHGSTFAISYNTDWEKLYRQLEKLQDELSDVTLQVADNKKEAGALTEIKIVMSVDDLPDAVLLTISYTAYQSSWRPKYDMRICSDKDHIEVDYYGVIKQSTGEEWKDVKIKLATVPVGMRPTHITYMGQQIQTDENFTNIQSPMTFKDSLFPVFLTVPNEASIPGDGSEFCIRATSLTMSAVELRYHCVPNVSLHVYVSARARNNSAFPLLAGSAMIYISNTYFTTRNIDAVACLEWLEFDLGADPAVQCDLKAPQIIDQRQDLPADAMLETCKYQFEICNNRTEQIIVIATWDLTKTNLSGYSTKFADAPFPGGSGSILRRGSLNPSMTEVTWQIQISAGQTHKATIVLKLQNIQDFGKKSRNGSSDSLSTTAAISVPPNAVNTNIVNATIAANATTGRQADNARRPHNVPTAHLRGFATGIAPFQQF